MLLNSYFSDIKSIEIPTVYIANSLGKIWGYIYGICILVAIFTTAVSSGYAFLKNVTNTKKKYLYLSLIICSLSIFASLLSFSKLIGNIYPVFGYLGILQIIFLLTA